MVTRVDQHIGAPFGDRPSRAPVLSVVTPAYNEASKLPLLHDRLCRVLDVLALQWEWIIVDDHSSDATFTVAAELAQRDPRIRCQRFSRNFGSHAAIACGLHHAPWRDGVKVVWAARRRRDGEKMSTVAFSRIYHMLMRRIAGITDIPATGADFFLIDRVVVEAVRRFTSDSSCWVDRNDGVPPPK